MIGYTNVFTDPDLRYSGNPGPLVQESITHDGQSVLLRKVLGPGGIIISERSPLDVERFKELVPADLTRGKVLTMPLPLVKHPDNPGRPTGGIVVGVLVVLAIVFLLPRL